MILCVFVAAGLLAGVFRAKARKTSIRAPSVKGLWMFLIAIGLQGFAFAFPSFRNMMPTPLVKIFLITSLSFLFMFAILNIHLPGFGIIAIGILLNLLVISLNGGLMPISPETVQKLFHGQVPGELITGERFGLGKDIILEADNTVLHFLSDCLTLPRMFQYQVAFSVGDVAIGVGAFWLLFNIPIYKEGDNKWFSTFRQKSFKKQQSILAETQK